MVCLAVLLAADPQVDCLTHIHDEMCSERDSGAIIDAGRRKPSKYSTISPDLCQLLIDSIVAIPPLIVNVEFPCGTHPKRS